MEIEEMKLRGLISAIKGQKNKGLIQVSENAKTGEYVVIVGKGIKREWGMFTLPQGLWRIRCRKEEVREAIDKLLTEKILT